MIEHEHELAFSEIKTVSGLTVKLRPVSQLMMQRLSTSIEKKYRERGEPLDTPTYTAKTVTGDVETHPHEVKVVDGKEISTLQTDEDKATWAAYQDATARLKAEQQEATTRLMLLKGLDVGEVPKAWIEEQAYFGITLPSDARDLALEYIQTEVLPTPEDIVRAIMGVMRLSAMGADTAAIEAAEASFRRALQGRTAAQDQPAAG